MGVLSGICEERISLNVSCEKASLTCQGCGTEYNDGGEKKEDSFTFSTKDCIIDGVDCPKCGGNVFEVNVNCGIFFGLMDKEEKTDDKNDE